MSLSSATPPAHAAELAQGGGAAPSASLTTVTAPTSFGRKAESIPEDQPAAAGD